VRHGGRAFDVVGGVHLSLPVQRSSFSLPLVDEEDERLEKKLKMQVCNVLL
jgi:hypothetical protein